MYCDVMFTAHMRTEWMLLGYSTLANVYYKLLQLYEWMPDVTTRVIFEVDEIQT